MKKFTVGDSYKVKLTGMANGGEALGHIEEMVVFVPYGAPGDEAVIRISEVKKNYLRGEIEQLLDKAPERVEPVCPIYYKCGGCHLQHIKYDAQLKYKSKIVEDAIIRLGRLEGIKVDDTQNAPEILHYRNKMQVVASSKPYLKSGKISPFFGLYARQSHQVIKMEDCAIQHPLTNKVLVAAREAVEKLQWSIYDEKSHSGMLRHIVTRISASENSIMLIIVATTDKIPSIYEFSKLVSSRVPELKGIIVNKNDRRTNVVLGNSFKKVWGDDFLIEEIEGIKYRISPNSFFQVNSAQTSKLFSILTDFLEPSKNDSIIDAYCGVGAISLWLAGKVKNVIGIEEVAEAEKDAVAGASLNSVLNFEFHIGKVEKILPELRQKGLNVDKLVIDPPRKGCDEAVLDAIAGMKVKRVVYVSCNPATLARDLAYLKDKGYRIDRVTPVDMFPQTYHIESVAKLTFDRIFN